MDFHSRLVAAVSQASVVAGDEIEPRYLGDWIFRNDAALPLALVRPKTTGEVSTTLRLCHEYGIPVVAQGGRTGLAGGAAPETGWVILSLERMRGVRAVDAASATVEAEAGAVLESVQQAAEASGLLFPLDIGGRGSCTVGGNVSTNAGGNRVLRYGMMRDLVLGLEVVLADGTILSSLNTMQKNNTGYDLKQLFIGSEGTLGVVTRVVLRLFPKPSSVQTALCAVKDYEAVVRLLGIAKARLGATLAAFEVMWPSFYRLATDGGGRRPPIGHGHGAYVLVENMGTDPERDDSQFQTFVESAFTAGVVDDAVVAQSLQDGRDMWAIRDASGEFSRTFWPYVGFDVSVPIGRIGTFVDACTARLAARFPTAETVWFGHAADSNIHICVRVRGADPQPEHEIDEIVYDCVGEFAGSISAEHGIGLLKRAYLGKSRGREEIATMRLLKRALDPGNILNPGKIFEVA